MTFDTKSRGLVAFCALGVLLFAVPIASQESPRFNHETHLERVIDCTGCHTLHKKTYEQKLVVGTGHKPCNSKLCHGAEFSKRVPKWAFCNTCHADKKNIHKRHYPPYRRRSESDWLVDKFAHDTHIERTSGKCKTCHADQKSRKRRKLTAKIPKNDKGDAGHKACASCHAKKVRPLMKECRGCHSLRAGREVAVAKSSTWYNDRVRYAFWHKAHEKDSRNKDCQACHANVRVGAGEAVPLPTMESCESCHNGKVAFDARGTQCRKCHLVPAGLGTPMSAAQSQYKHNVHANAGLALRCDGCHGSSAEGKIKFPGGDNHKPCANLGCHGNDFRRSNSKICTTCHAHSDPWRANPARSPRDRSGEFFVGFSHKNHDKRIRDQKGCGTCHPTQAGLPAAAIDPSWLAPAHRDCAACHAEFARPAMSDCGGCHKLEPTSKSAAAETDPKWRVRAKFQHETHRQDARSGQQLGCTACHGDVLSVAPGARIPRPSMKDCSTCHNGTVAFKTTGHDCAKCHGPASPGGGAQ
jgi:c(7)-type cytochrome triheme protein